MNPKQPRCILRVIHCVLALGLCAGSSLAAAALLAVPGKAVPAPTAKLPASSPPPIAPTKPGQSLAPAKSGATTAPATAAAPVAGPVERVEQSFSFDRLSPASATLGLGLTQAGPILVELQWSGAAELQVALREAGQAGEVLRQSVRGGRAQAQLTITPEQVRRQPLWAVVVTGVAGVQGNLVVSFPKGQTQAVEQSVQRLRESQGAQGKQARLAARPRLQTQVSAAMQRPRAPIVATAVAQQGRMVAPATRSVAPVPSATVPALSGPVQVSQAQAAVAPEVRLARAERGDVILPKGRVVVEGKGLAAGQKVHFIWPVHSGEDIVAAGQGPSADSLVLDLPDGAGFAAPVNVPLWVEGAGGLMSNRVQFTLTPERETLELDLRDFTAELMTDHWGFVLFEPLMRDPYWPLIDPVGSTKFSTLALPDAQMLSAAFQHKMVMIDAQRTSLLWYFGGKGDDEYLKNTRLKNGWVVQGVTFDNEGNSAYGGYGAQLIEHRIGTPSLFTKVHWWYDAAGYVGYRVGYVIEGPKGVPYK